MLFVFQSEAPRSFWMQDTYVALDIAYLDVNFRIVDIQQMEPQTEELHSSAGARHVRPRGEERVVRGKGHRGRSPGNGGFRSARSEDQLRGGRSTTACLRYTAAFRASTRAPTSSSSLYK